MKFTCVDLNKIDYIIDNLSDKSIEELKVLYGEDYEVFIKSELYNLSSNQDIRVICLDNGTPCAIFGLFPYYNSLNIFFVTTTDYKKVSSFYVVKQSIKQIKLWLIKYKKDLLSQVLKTNNDVIKWLKLLGFKEKETSELFIIMRKKYCEV